MARGLFISLVCGASLMALAGGARAASLVCDQEIAAPACAGEVDALSCEASDPAPVLPVATVRAAPAFPETPLACEMGALGPECSLRLPAQSPPEMSPLTVQARWRAAPATLPRPGASAAPVAPKALLRAPHPGYAGDVFRPPR